MGRVGLGVWFRNISLKSNHSYADYTQMYINCDNNITALRHVDHQLYYYLTFVNGCGAMH